MEKENHDNRGTAEHSSTGRDPYAAGLVGGRPRIESRTVLNGRIVAVLTSKRDERGLQLIHPYTRCIKKTEVHEVLLTDEVEKRPGDTVNRVAAICFMEFFDSGVVMEGDTLVVTGREIGQVTGFDETHCPNHINIVLRGKERKTGLDWNLKGGDLFTFRQD